MALIKCPNCGKQYSEHAEKCPKCGLSFQDATDHRAKRKSRNKVIAWCISLLSIIAALVVALSSEKFRMEYLTGYDIQEARTGKFFIVNRHNWRIKKLNYTHVEKVLKDSDFAVSSLALTPYNPDDLLLAKNKNDKVGIINHRGETIIPLEYDSIDYLKDDSDALIFIMNKDGKYGVCNQNGEIIVPIKYDSIVGNDNELEVSIDGEKRMLDFSGKEIAPSSNESQDLSINGSLPEGYSWAYGGWTYHHDSWGDVDLIIGENYVQSNTSYFAVYSSYDNNYNNAGWYPIYCFPKQNYSISQVSEDEIEIYYDSAWYYEENVTLNKKTKTATIIDEVLQRKSFTVSQDIIKQYQKAYNASPVWGEWRRQEDDNDTMNLSPDNNFVLTKSGVIVSLGGVLKTIGNDGLLFCYPDDDGHYYANEFIRAQPNNKVDSQTHSPDNQSTSPSVDNNAKKGTESGSSQGTYDEPTKESNNSKSNIDKDEPIPFQNATVKPTFNGGDANEFSKWVNSQLQYPEKAKEEGIQGSVLLQFKVNTDGSVSDVKVLRGVSRDLDLEAVRVVSSSPNWEPALFDGKVVPVIYTFPVIFQLR